MTTKQYYVMKWLAMIFMLIDHIASAFHEVFNWDTGFYLFCRTIGRLAFPLFCFMLVESFYFTENRMEHLKKIAMLALISEVPFDLALRGEIIATSSQNVCVTLALGFIMLEAIDYFTPRIYEYVRTDVIVKRFAIPVFNILVLFAFGFAASVLSTDYGFSGIFLIWGLNAAIFANRTNIWRAVVIAIFICMRLDVMYVICFIDLSIIYILTRKSDSLDKIKFLETITSKKAKAICSTFYPVHLTVIAVLRAIFA